MNTNGSDQTRSQPSVSLETTPPPQTMLGSGKTYTGGMPSSNWQPRLPIQNSPQPGAMAAATRNPLQSLRIEREYLDQNLLTQGQRAKRLHSHLAVLQDRLRKAESKAEAARSRRQMRNLGKDLVLSTQQREAALLRLNDLNVEIRSRECWDQVQRQRVAAQPITSGNYHSSSLASFSTPTSGYTRSPATPNISSSASRLNPSSQEFVPAVISHEDVPPNLAWEYADWTSDEPDRLHKLPLPSRRQLSQRRLSLPCLQSVWPGTGIGLDDEDDGSEVADE